MLRRLWNYFSEASAEREMRRYLKAERSSRPSEAELRSELERLTAAACDDLSLLAETVWRFANVEFDPMVRIDASFASFEDDFIFTQHQFVERLRQIWKIDRRRANRLLELSGLIVRQVGSICDAIGEMRFELNGADWAPLETRRSHLLRRLSEVEIQRLLAPRPPPTYYAEAMRRDFER